MPQEIFSLAEQYRARQHQITIMNLIAADTCCRFFGVSEGFRRLAPSKSLIFLLGVPVSALGAPFPSFREFDVVPACRR